MPFILPTLMLLERAPLIQNNFAKRLQFLKNIFYFRVTSYCSFFLINQLNLLL
jgi:hypothetical protein